MSAVRRIDASVLKTLLPRPSESHKGTFGTLCMFCGSEKMPGAAFLSAFGALRSGVGLLKLAASPSVSAVLQTRLAEPVWVSPQEIENVQANAFLCGCGLSRAYDDLLEYLLPQIRIPAVYDADCINFLSLHKDVANRLQNEYILTPHPAEFHRLCGKSIAEIQQNRIGLAAEYAHLHRCVLVLKGHETVVASPSGEVAVNTSGNSALAKGGSGDVLAGVIASLVAQGHSCFDAACIGVYVHGKAGELLSETYGEHGALPSDLPVMIGKLLG